MHAYNPTDDFMTKVLPIMVRWILRPWPPHWSISSLQKSCLVSSLSGLYVGICCELGSYRAGYAPPALNWASPPRRRWRRRASGAAAMALRKEINVGIGQPGYANLSLNHGREGRRTKVLSMREKKGGATVPPKETLVRQFRKPWMWEDLSLSLPPVSLRERSINRVTHLP